jgi:hypothetical protein
MLSSKVEHALIQSRSPRIPLQSIRSVRSPNGPFLPVVVDCRLSIRFRLVLLGGRGHVAAETGAEDIGIPGGRADGEGFGGACAGEAEVIRLWLC